MSNQNGIQLNNRSNDTGQVTNSQPGVNSLSINEDNLIKSRTHVVKNNYWNDRHERILKGLQANSNKYFREYQRAHLVYKKKLRLYRIPIIVMSSLSGFLSISNSGYIPAEYNKWVSMLVGFVNLMVTVISLIENFKKIDVNMNKTYSAYLDFKKLHDEISMVLNTPQNEREDNGYDTANTFFSRYESYVNDAPILGKAFKDALDENSPDNNSQTLNQSGSDISTNTDGQESLYTELDEESLVDNLESQTGAVRKTLQRMSSGIKNSLFSSSDSNISPGSPTNKNGLRNVNTNVFKKTTELEQKVNKLSKKIPTPVSTPISSRSRIPLGSINSVNSTQLQNQLESQIQKQMQNQIQNQVKKLVELDPENIDLVNDDEENQNNLDDQDNSGEPQSPSTFPVIRNVKVSQGLNLGSSSSILSTITDNSNENKEESSSLFDISNVNKKKKKSESDNE